MAFNDQVLDAYHRAVGRHRERTGESYPLVRVSCIEDDGSITDTNVFEHNVVARWSVDALDRIRIRLT